MSRPAISALVVTFQTGPRLKECLYALLADPDIDEIVIIDNGNPEPMRAWLSAFARDRANVRRLAGHGNIGFGAAINLGVREADGPHILVINPDAVLRWDSLAGMQSVARTCQTPWIVGGKIFNLAGKEERGPRRRELTVWCAAAQMLGWNTWTLERHPAPEGPVAMPVISGAFFLTSKDSLDVLEGFDEAYFLHVEDVDLCRRCREIGGVVMYDPRSGALHYGSTSDVAARTIRGHKADSLAYYFRKFARGPLARLGLALVLPVLHFAMRRRPD